MSQSSRKPITVEHWYGVTFNEDGRRCITVSYPRQNRLVVCHYPGDTEEERIDRAVRAAVKMATDARGEC